MGKAFSCVLVSCLTLLSDGFILSSTQPPCYTHTVECRSAFFARDAHALSRVRACQINNFSKERRKRNQLEKEQPPSVFEKWKTIFQPSSLVLPFSLASFYTR